MKTKKTAHRQLTAEIPLTVPFHDVDSMSIVWHGHYIKYFELARCELLDELNYLYVEMAGSGYSWPVIEANAKYVQPLRYRQQVIVRAVLSDWDLRLKIDYQILDPETRARLTKGYTVQVAVDPKSGTLCMPLPEKFRERVESKLAK